MLRGLLAVSGLLVVAATGTLLLQWEPEPEEPLALSDRGIGPLLLDRSFDQAERRAFRAAPETAFSGLGCAGLDEIRYDGWLDGRPVSVMAMADQGRIREVEAMLYRPAQAEDRKACIALRNDFAQPFLDRFGPFEQSWEINKPVSEELLARTGPVVIAARWFAMGRSCYVSAHYGVLDGGSVRLGESLASTDYRG
ncbi:MAG: hypothetical protein V2J42_10735 [Wenzhouxiangella sp.]|jgi:hypothetical protein|nr:hypothetical protein [Wenzhouxiangella sp.]